MDALRNLQFNFLNYLQNDEAIEIVNFIESTPQCSAKQRMAFYGNAYILRLKEALSIDYERLHSYLGDDLFEHLIQNYIESYPSHNPSLRFFGRNMVHLVENLEPFKQLSEVAEITRIEQAFGDSFDAVDTQSITLDQLAQLKPTAWATLTLRFHDAVQLLPQHYNSFQIWQAMSNKQAPPIKTTCDTTWLIWRKDMVSRYRALEAAELSALKTAKSGGNFAKVCEALLDYYSETETPQKAITFLQQWINDQMICKLN